MTKTCENYVIIIIAILFCSQSLKILAAVNEKKSPHSNKSIIYSVRDLDTSSGYSYQQYLPHEAASHYPKRYKKHHYPHYFKHYSYDKRHEIGDHDGGGGHNSDGHDYGHWANQGNKWYSGGHGHHDHKNLWDNAGWSDHGLNKHGSNWGNYGGGGFGANWGDWADKAHWAKDKGDSIMQKTSWDKEYGIKKAHSNHGVHHSGHHHNNHGDNNHYVQHGGYGHHSHGNHGTYSGHDWKDYGDRHGTHGSHGHSHGHWSHHQPFHQQSYHHSYHH